MTTANKDHLYFDLAFKLAYFIHVTKEVAFFVAEDALEELPLMLGNQEKNRKPAERLSGFWKWGERTRPVRQTVRLSESQLVQWLVYKQSESWERRSESGTGLYSPTEDDMIIRYIEHLVFITLRRGSFYVTLAIAQLLHQFDRRETRLLYDILTQSDSARMKDMGYIGKQRLELLGRICKRFEQKVHTVQIPGGEKQLEMQPTTEAVNKVVRESLRRFTPWDTECVVKPGFDVTDIPALYFQAGSIDEDPIEMHRIHTLLDPMCFARFVEGLGKYARQLPNDNQDKGCNYDGLSERLAVPRFFNFSRGPSRGDRLESPRLTQLDYVRLERTLDARASRRKSFAAQQLSVYVDNVLTESFDPQQSQVKFVIGPEAGVIEVRGRDNQGVLTLAILLVDFDHLPVGVPFRDSVVGPGGQKVQIQLTPTWGTDRETKCAVVEVRYAHSSLLRRIAQTIRRPKLGLSNQLSRDSRVAKRSNLEYAFSLSAWAAIALVVAATLIWFVLPRSKPGTRPPEQAEQPATEVEKPGGALTPPKMPEQTQSAKKTAPLIARVTWSADRQAALRAIATEPSRGEVKTIDLSRRREEVFLSLPLYDDAGSTYSRYRVTLIGDKRLWQQTLRAPKESLTGNAHILSLMLDARRLQKENQYDLRVEGWTRSGWHSIGHVLLNPTER